VVIKKNKMNSATRDLRDYIEELDENSVVLLQDLHDILEDGADPNVRERSVISDTFLHRFLKLFLHENSPTADISACLQLFMERTNFNPNLLNGEGLGLIHILALLCDPTHLSFFLTYTKRRQGVVVDVDLKTQKTAHSSKYFLGGRTALFFACTSGDGSVHISQIYAFSKTSMLLKKGANPNAICDNGDNPLIYLLHYYHIYYDKVEFEEIDDIVEILLDYNTNPNTVSNVDGGVSALTEAVRYQQSGYICDVLLKHGADPLQYVKEGVNPYEEALRAKNWWAINIFLDWKKHKNMRWNVEKNDSERMMQQSIIHRTFPQEIRKHIGSFIFKEPLPH